MADGSYPAPVAANSYVAHTHAHPNYPYPPQQSTIFQAAPPQPPPQPTTAAPAQGSYYHNQHQQAQQQPSQEQEENTSTTGPNNEKNSKWTARDDIDLLDALIKERELGRARDMKWTNEAWNEIAAALEGSEVVSGGGKKTVQQCKARWQRLKIEYRHVKYLRGQPLFSWDEETCMVTASPSDWQNYLVDHKDAQPWRKKAFAGYTRVERLLDGSSEEGPPELTRAWKAPESGPGSPASDRQALIFSPPTSSELNGKRKSTTGQSVSQHKRTRTTQSQSHPQSQQSFSATSAPVPVPAPAYAYAPPPPPSHHQAPSPVVLSAMATAIQVVEQSENLQDEEFVKVVRLFRRRPSAADAYLAIHSPRARSMYLRAELEDFDLDKDRQGVQSP